ncbi:hypothetical protein EE612_002666 [Oryza sativa]|nr:hypothetical protein EE612_002666 [Oryza sativa]
MVDLWTEVETHQHVPVHHQPGLAWHPNQPEDRG